MTAPIRKPWVYHGVGIYPADRNSSGIRWYARADLGFPLRADTKDGMRELIRHYIVEPKKKNAK